MPRRETPAVQPRSSWRDRLTIAWVALFGILYLRTVLTARTPGLWSRIVEAIGLGI